jgi:cephalosporin hydroxylase
MPLQTEWIVEATRLRHPHQFSWLGRPIIQFPADIVATQEVLWRTRPDFVLETGVAHGGSLVLSASVLELLGGDGIVVGVDIDIRAHNRKAIEEHPLARRIRLVEGSSTDPAVAAEVYRLAEGRRSVFVLLDSNHSADHVRRELELYAPLVRAGGYLVVGDTVVEDFPPGTFDRPWDRGNSPKTAAREFLAANDRFVVDHELEDKLLMTCNPEGWLRCVRD